MKEDKIWQDYLSKHFEKFLNGLTEKDFNDGKKLNSSDIEIDKSIPKNTYISLRKYINQDAIKSLQNRFRAHKHRQKTGIKNIQLKESYLSMLDRFKVKVAAETLEEAIDFLLSSDYTEYRDDVKAAKEAVGEGAYTSDELMLSGFVSRLNNYDRQRVSLLIEHVFKSGWDAAKATRKRSVEARTEALEQLPAYKNVNMQITKPNDEEKEFE